MNFEAWFEQLWAKETEGYRKDGRYNERLFRFARDDMYRKTKLGWDAAQADNKVNQIVEHALDSAITAVCKDNEKKSVDGLINRVVRNMRKNLKQLKTAGLIVNYDPIKIDYKKCAVSLSYYPVRPAKEIIFEMSVKKE